MLLSLCLLLSQVLRHKGEVHACATFVASLYFGFAVQLVAAFLDDGHAVVVELFGVGVDADAVVFDAEVDAVVGLFFQRYQYAAAV